CTDLQNATRLRAERWKRPEPDASKLLDGDPSAHAVPRLCCHAGTILILHCRTLVETLPRMGTSGAALGTFRRGDPGAWHFDGRTLGIRNAQFRGILELGSGRKCSIRAVDYSGRRNSHDDQLQEQ